MYFVELTGTLFSMEVFPIHSGQHIEGFEWLPLVHCAGLS